jgi:putative hemolysin
MPLITMKDIESLSPIFKGEKGNKTAKRLLRLMGIDRLSVDSIRGVRSAIAQLKDGHPLGLFPAGAVSNFHWNDFRIYDREWQASALRLIQKMKVPVLPIRFFDRNSTFFYFLGMFGWKVRSMRLPKEILNKAGREIRVGIGPVISVEEQQECANWKDLGIKLREAVYGMDKKM